MHQSPRTAFGRLVRLFLAACPAGVGWGALALGTACFATDYHAVLDDKTDVANPHWDWSNPWDWQTADKAHGVPSSAQDVGIIDAGHRIAVWDPLGTNKNRPALRVEKHAMLLMTRDLVNPLVLDGGFVNGDWMGKSVQGPLTITADSTIGTRDEWGGWQINLNGPVSNPSPVTLHVTGMVMWRSDSSKTFTGAIDVDRGALGIFVGPLGSGIAGTGPIQLATQTALMITQPTNLVRYQVPNALFGNGAIFAGNMYPQNIVAFSGQTLHPGLPNQPGTLSVRAGSFEFKRNAGKPVEFVVEVRGDGSNPKADYSQLAIFGNLGNSLDNADLVLRLLPDMTPEQAAALRLNVITTQKNDATRLNLDYQPFHSVRVIAGKRTGSATVKVVPDPMTDGYDVEVSAIVLK